MNFQVKSFYDNNPYPQISSFATVQLPEKLFETCALAVNKNIPDEPEILITGCGTIAASAIAQAYPYAKRITAVDISDKTLEIAKANTPKRFQNNIEWINADIGADYLLNKLTHTQYDWIHCTGVLHHLECPENGIKNLSQLLKEDGIIKYQLYSEGARLWIEWTRQAFLLKEAKVADDVRNILKTLPSEHPFRFVLSTYPETKSNSGLLDGFLHPQVELYDILEWQNIFKKNNLEISTVENLYYLDDLNEIFPENVLKAIENLNIYEKIVLLENLGEWRSDFKGVITKLKSLENVERTADIVTKYSEIMPENYSYPRYYLWQQAKATLKKLDIDISKDELSFIIDNLSERHWLPGAPGISMRLKWKALNDMARLNASSNFIFTENKENLIDDYFNNNCLSIPEMSQWKWEQYYKGLLCWEW